MLPSFVLTKKASLLASLSIYILELFSCSCHSISNETIVSGRLSDCLFVLSLI